MKNQYFGDINDYKKYALLRCLTNSGKVSLAVCWMLTPDDQSDDGKFTKYLDQPETWREYDADLFDALHKSLKKDNVRNIAQSNPLSVLKNAVYHDALLKDDKDSRRAYFDSLIQIAQNRELIFFDPDNGIEVKSVPKGRKRSSKYIYWDEIVQAFDTGKSLLIYQHFPYVKRDIFIVGKSDEIKSRTGINRVYSFRTANVVFFLLPSSVERAAFFESQGAIIQEVWGNRIRMGIH